MRNLIFPAMLALTAFAAEPAKSPVVPDKAPDRFTSAALGSQHIEGVLGDRMRVNLEGRLLHVDEKSLIDCFEHRPGPQDWAGEHAGKFLHAAANTWLYTDDPRLKTLMDRMARELIATQLPDGYLGTYTDDKRWTSWDVWVHKYDLLGLVAYYQATGYQPALEASRKIGDLLVRTFGTGPGQRDIVAAGTHVGMAATSVLEAMVNLYRFTGDVRYLNFCEYLVRSWDQPNGPKIIASLLSTQSVFHTANAKAYEMMSDLVGLCELYRLTGDERYFKAALAAQRDVVAHHRYLTGTASAHEHFRDDFDLPAEQKDEVGEGCVTVTWLQLNLQLLRLTGEAQYAQQIERTVFNQLLAAQDPLTGNICYFTPMDGRKKPSTDINCCRSSEPRGISLIPRLLWGALDLIPPGVIVDPVDPRRAIPAAVAIEIIAPGEALIAGVHVKSETNYPFDGHAVFTLTPDQPHRFTFALRVPEWAAAFRATGPDGKQVTGRPGEYLRLNRKWKRGDRVEVDVDLAVRFTPGGKSYPNYVAVERGPLVLALDKGASPNIPDLNQAALKTLPEQLTAEKSGLYDLPGVVTENGHARDVTLHLVPFAAAREYRIWLPQPAAAPAPGR
jgi:hypothetical protein